MYMQMALSRASAGLFKLRRRQPNVRCFLSSAADARPAYPAASDAVASGISDSEWQQRCALAVAYRVAHVEGWDQQIFNHITLKVEGSEAEADGP